VSLKSAGQVCLFLAGVAGCFAQDAGNAGQSEAGNIDSDLVHDRYSFRSDAARCGSRARYFIAFLCFQWAVNGTRACSQTVPGAGSTRSFR
jgi:hypothetical protein